MKKPTSIQLNISSPCHEDWNAMSKEEQGRFCGQCQKTVIDFTTWSDNDLFSFFSKNNTSVCGRFFPTQLQKELHIPPQPASRLYRLAIACGLTLMFAQIPEAHAMVKQQVELLATHTPDDGDPEKTGNNTGSVKGRVTDKSRRPMAGAVVEVSLGGLIKATTTTDKEGRYEIKGLTPGEYEVTALHLSGNRDEKTLKLTGEKTSIADFSLEDRPLPVMGTVAYPGPEMKGDVQVVEPPTPPPHTEKGKVKVKR